MTGDRSGASTQGGVAGDTGVFAIDDNRRLRQLVSEPVEYDACICIWHRSVDVNPAAACLRALW